MTIVADIYQYVIGVDTHAATHHYAVIHPGTGAVLDDQQFPTTPAGLRRAADWISRRTGDPTAASPVAGTDHVQAGVLISAEGTGSYGAQLAQLLTERGYRVVEAPTPDRKRVRGKGKSDKADAIAAGRSVLSQELSKLRDRRTGGMRTALQALVTRRDELNRRRTVTINMLTALLRANALGVDARHALTIAQLRQVAAWRPRHEPLDMTILRELATQYAQDILVLDQQRVANEKQIRQIVQDQAPELLDMYGIGPINAAIILTVWSHPGRIRSAAALSSIAGTAPVTIESGNSRATRLNRGGDRRLNRAIASIILTRSRTEESKAYIARRVAQGKTPKQAKRMLRTYLTRKIFRTLTAAHPTTTAQPPITSIAA